MRSVVFKFVYTMQCMYNMFHDYISRSRVLVTKTGFFPTSSVGINLKFMHPCGYKFVVILVPAFVPIPHPTTLYNLTQLMI